MLEIRNLRKVYKGKSGAEVRALDGVSAKFGDKGLVFVLGKSGSGKSTLLNVCGGLDKPDNGEIIIDGRSSETFTPSDFDSYRNTFVGFIFQEYNILDEFSVEENIALALELQGKGKERGKVADILARVDMAEFAARKPNTLSGGQKQRVAIARALVKDPEIIMADEPTGALDSETGEQVLQTLKKLSQEKLVMVVSHDRDFAARYADRIIELKDGKIISDLSRTHEEGAQAFDPEEGTLRIKKGAVLTGEDVEKINNFLLSCDKDLIISRDERTFMAESQFFADTLNEPSEGGESLPPRPLIRSRLPMKHALRMGASGLKVKPLRLFFTIFLSFISFTFFGMYSTLTFFDSPAATLASYEASDMQTINMRKFYASERVEYFNGEEKDRTQLRTVVNFTPGDLNEMRALYGAETLGAMTFSSSSGMSYEISNADNGNAYYYSTELSAFALFDANAWEDRMLTRTDLHNLADDEIVISSYTFDSLRESGVSDKVNGGKMTLESYEDIVGKTLIISTDYYTSLPLKVAGVYKNDLPEKYDMLRTAEDIFDDYDLYQKFLTERSFGTYEMALVGDGFYEANVKYFPTSPAEYKDYGFTYLSDKLKANVYYGDEEYATYYFNAINTLPVTKGEAPDGVTFFDGRQNGTLNEGEIAVPIEFISPQIEKLLNEYLDRLHSDLAYAEGDEAAAIEEEIESVQWKVSRALNVLLTGLTTTDVSSPSGEPNEITVKASLEDLENAAKEIVYLLSKTGTTSIEQDICFDDDKSAGDFRAAALYYGNVTELERAIYLSSSDFDALWGNVRDEQWTYETVTRYTPLEDEIITFIAVPYPEGSSTLRDLVYAEFSVDDADCSFVLESEITSVMTVAESVIDMFSNVLLWIGIVTALFAMLLLFNFISVSITYKKKEIGILRAVGARSADVFKIFCCESLIIAAVCYILAMISCFALCAAINAELASSLGIALLVFGPISWLIMLAIAALTSIVATFLPVYGIAKRRPVDSIRAL